MYKSLEIDCECFQKKTPVGFRFMGDRKYVYRRLKGLSSRFHETKEITRWSKRRGGELM